MANETKRIDGQSITSAYPHYENVRIVTADGTEFFLTSDELTAIMNEFLFDVEKKKTRSWATHVEPDVDLLYEQEKYEQAESFLDKS